jgi:large subunit ribosomal protein L1
MARNKHGKRYREVAELVDRAQAYPPAEALALARKASFAKFDETVEVHMRLGVDPRHADQQVRGVVLLPHGTGREVRVLVFAEGEDARIAEEAGADFVGSDDLAQKIQGGWLDFDVALATPPMMRIAGRLGKILGPRGLMPNPKAGTVVAGEDMPRIIDEMKKGRIEFRVDKTGNLHIPIGKLSFDDQQLLDNLGALIDEVVRARPPGAKGQFVRNIVLTTTMGPGIKLDLSQALTLRPAA